MKKILPKILIILNIIFIVFLCLISGIMLFMGSSSQKYLFGRSAVVFTDLTNNAPHYKLLFLQKDLSQLEIGERVVYYTTDLEEKKSYFVNTVTAMDDKILAFEGEKNFIERSSSTLLGKVTSENQWLGELLFSIQNSGNRSTIYILILSFFMVLSILAILLLIISERKKNLAQTEQAPEKPVIDIEIEDTEPEMEQKKAPIAQKAIAEEPFVPIPLVEREEALPQSEPTPQASRPKLEIIYEDDAENGELVRRPKAVAPAPLSQSKLSSNNPLYDPHGDYTTPPTNIGSQKARRFIPFDERSPSASLLKEDTGELDLSAFYEVMEHTTELIYTEELVDNLGNPIAPKAEVPPTRVPQESVSSPPVSEEDSPVKEEPAPPKSEFQFNIDSMLEDIISQAQNDLYSDKKE